MEFLKAFGFQPAIEIFDAYEIHGCCVVGSQDEDTELRTIEQCDDQHAEFWCLFGHVPGKGLFQIGDFKTREEAEDIYSKITGKDYNEE